MLFLYGLNCFGVSTSGLCRAYDRAAVRFRGLEADINFVISDYEEDLKQVLIAHVEKTCILLMCSYLVFFNFYRWRIFPRRKLCKYFGDRALVSPGAIQDIKEFLCRRLAGGGELK